MSLVHAKEPSRPSCRSREAGIGLPMVLLASAVGAAVSMAIVSNIGRHSTSSRKNSSTLELVGTRERLYESVSCGRTFGAATPPNPCVNNTYLNLLSESGATIVAAGGSNIGGWTVRAKCNTTLGRIELRSARLTPGAPILAFPVATGQYNPAHYVADEMGGVNIFTNRPLRYDWEHPLADLIEPGRPGLCQDWFSNPVNSLCPAGQYIEGYDFADRTPLCRAFPVNCGVNEVLTFNGSTWACQRAMQNGYIDGRTDRVMQTEQGWITTTMINTSNQIITATVPGMIDQAITANNNSFVFPRDTQAINSSNNFTEQKFDNMINGQYYEKWVAGDSACASLSNTTCPNSYYLFALEWKMATAGSGCRVQCRRIQ